jgi:hypothetical protein
MALSIKRKKQLAKEPLIISEEKLSLFNTIVEKVGGLSEFEKAMNLWQFKCQKEIVEDIISPEELAKIFSYDEYGNLYLKKNCRIKKAGDKVGSLRHGCRYIRTQILFGDYYFTTNINKIVFCLYNRRWPKKGYDVDHINGITTDNSPNNLREGTKSQNGGNRKLSKNSSTGFKGVSVSFRPYKDKKGGSVFVRGRIECNGIRYIKSVTVLKKPLEIVIQELKAWRDEKSKELFGEFHRSS